MRDALLKIEGWNTGFYGPLVWGGQADYGVNHQLLQNFWITQVKDGKPNTLAIITPEKR